MIMFLVRHGEAGAKGSWDGPDAGRPLSPAGLDQAEGLVLRLEDYPVERILCSPTVRCVDGDPSEILELFWDWQLPNTVLCTHGEMIGRLFGLLAGQGLVAPAPLVWPKGSAWLHDPEYLGVCDPMAVEGLQDQANDTKREAGTAQ